MTKSSTGDDNYPVRKGNNIVESFWVDRSYALENYLSKEEVSQELIDTIEEELGYKLPESYINLMQTRNGGIPTRRCYPAEPNGWADDHVEIADIVGLGFEKAYSLCGSMGSKFWIDEWGYPDIGIYFGSTPSGGHEMFALSYANCGRDGEPEVVYVDQERNYKILTIAPNFKIFIDGLVREEDFE